MNKGIPLASRQCPTMRPRIRLPRPRHDRASSTAPQRGRTPVLRSVQESLRRDEEAGALKVDAERKTVTAAGAELPLSPVMDPAFLEASQEFRVPKGRAQGEPSGRFRKLLSENVYARALDSPVRFCYMTRTRLPRSLLQQFRPVLSEATDTAFWAPTDLPTPPPTDAHAEPEKGARGGPCAYALRNEAILTPTPDNPMRRMGISRQLMVPKMYRIGKLPGGRPPVYREGMGGAVLGMLREEATGQLLGILETAERTGTEYLFPVGGFEEARGRKDRGCILWMGPGSEGGDGAPGRYATLDVDVQYGAKMPVHNLHLVLGAENVERLRERSALFRDGGMLVLAKARTVKAQEALWRIQGCLAGEEGR